MRRKFGNIPTEVDGIRFDSRKEARHWVALKLLERSRKVLELRRQVSYPLVVNGHRVAKYVADFVYLEPDGQLIVEDVKSEATKTPIFNLKAKLMRAIYGIEIRCV